MGSMKHARLMCSKAITNAVHTEGQKPTTKAGKSKEKIQQKRKEAVHETSVGGIMHQATVVGVVGGT